MPGSGHAILLKFGGTSVEDAAAFERVAVIVAAAGEGAVVVTSALSGVTDALMEAVRLAAGGAPAASAERAAAVLERHRAVAAELGVAAPVADAERKLAELLAVIAEHPGTQLPLQDEVVSFGERMSSALLADVLRARAIDAQGVDARQCIRTDEEYTRAVPLGDVTAESTRAHLMPLLDRGIVPVLGGFIGSTVRGATTTLGRGGSDFSAALVAAALDARELQIWTDVSGFLTADPRVVPGARTIDRLLYAEAAELAYFGAKVLHPKTIQPAVERRIPVRICNSRQPGSAGTLIDDRAAPGTTGIRAIAHKTGITVIQVTSARMLGAYGFLRATFEVFDRHRTAVDIVATSEVSVSLTVEDTARLDAIVRELESLGQVTVEPGHAIVCVVGEGLRRTSGIATRVFRTLADINVVLISQGASSINLTFVVAERDVNDVVQRLHSEFFS